MRIEIRLLVNRKMYTDTDNILTADVSKAFPFKDSY